ncbi:MAG: hypothetical protein LBT78_05870, partial [Tannerella sp.]|nr:hypothetical protein [Tannerella sp.]
MKYQRTPTKKTNVICVLLCLCMVMSANAQSTYTKSEGQPLVIELTDHLRHPYFWWPSTLLSYPVQFGEPIKPEGLTLTCNGKEIPFQLSEVASENGYVKTAVLNFISDLPTGASYKFELSAGSPQHSTPFVSEEVRDDAIVLSSSKLSVSLPRSGNYP